MNKRFMQAAIKAAKKGRKNVFPNPPVGCIIAKDKKIIAEGYHEYFGGNHAEINAILKAGKKAKGADMYITLEPCNSSGKRPPCTDAIIKSGIKRVFFAVKDPQVSGSITKLEKNGIKVYCGLSEREASELIKEYRLHLKQKSAVTVKAAMTLDGKIATSKYDSKWITSQKARDFSRKLRSEYDAVLVGTNTVLYDNPHLTSSAERKNPVRVILDFDLKTPRKSNVLDLSAATIVLYDKKYKNIPSHFSKKNIFLLPVDAKKAKKDFKIIKQKLESAGIKTILIEGGGEVISSALFSGVVDDIIFFVAPKIAGGKNAISPVGGKGAEKISSALRIKNMQVKKIGKDFVFTGKIRG